MKSALHIILGNVISNCIGKKNILKFFKSENAFLWFEIGSKIYQVEFIQ